MKAFKIILISTAMVSLLLLYFFFDAREHAFPQCPSRVYLGFHCAGCGSQRALSALLHGDLLAAMRLNILFLFSLPVVGYAAYARLRSKSFPLMYHPWFAKSVLVAVILFTILRNIPVYPFTLMAPMNSAGR
jgi:hypothetical protein